MSASRGVDVERPHQRVEQATEVRALGFPNDLAPGTLGARERRLRGHAVHLQRVFLVEPVVRPADERNVVGVGTGGLDHPLDGLLVVRRAGVEQVERALLVVEVGVQVGDEHGDVDARLQEVGELSHRREVADVHLAGGGVADVRRRLLFVREQRLQFLVSDDLLRVPGRQVETLGGVHTGCGRSGD